MKDKEEIKFEGKPLCMRCYSELELIEEDTEDGTRLYKCPECLTLHSVLIADEEEKKDYPFYNKELASTIPNQYHGYDGLCPVCGHHIIWMSDFMRSEVLGDVDENDVDENGLLNDDALASDVFCVNCGTNVSVIEPKPSELEEREKKNEGE